tara:strand:- start:155 stop:760 length:606 start_codon:yes stop_codon:yes gene_type:complete
VQKILISILTFIFYSSIASADTIKIDNYDFGFVCTPYGMLANEQKISLPNDKYPSFSKNLNIRFDIFNSANQKMILAKGFDMKLKKRIPVSVAGSMTGDKMGSPKVKIKYMWYHKYPNKNMILHSSITEEKNGEITFYGRLKQISDTNKKLLETYISTNKTKNFSKNDNEYVKGLSQITGLSAGFAESGKLLAEIFGNCKS